MKSSFKNIPVAFFSLFLSFLNDSPYRNEAAKHWSLQEYNSYQKWNSHLKILSAACSLCLHSVSYKNHCHTWQSWISPHLEKEDKQQQNGGKIPEWKTKKESLFGHLVIGCKSVLMRSRSNMLKVGQDKGGLLPQISLSKSSSASHTALPCKTQWSWDQILEKLKVLEFYPPPPN